MKEEVKVGDLVRALYSYNASSHALLIASAPNSPVKGQPSGLRMVSSSLNTASPEVASRSFTEQSK